MKRGLKVYRDEDTNTDTKCYNRFPDEKGTESYFSPRLVCLSDKVTIVSPMKRGLKVRVRVGTIIDFHD